MGAANQAQSISLFCGAEEHYGEAGEMSSMRTVWGLSLGITMGAVLFLVSSAFSGDPEFDKQCARVIDVQRKSACGDNSLLVVAQNICGHPIQMSVCVQQPDSTWDCGLDRNVQPERKMGRWTCEGTGEYRILGCSRDSADCNAIAQEPKKQ
jgi:hypothetical protein